MIVSLVTYIKYYHGTLPKFWKLIEVLAAAKTTRDDGNLESLRKVWDRVVDLWLNYLDDHDAFESKITESILASSVLGILSYN